ncbi:hypothetical protein STEG23_006437 [Scotinomys teguina]
MAKQPPDTDTFLSPVCLFEAGSCYVFHVGQDLVILKKKKEKLDMPRNISTKSRDMDPSVEGAAASPEVPQELLEEMIWFFRVEDAAPWNYSILVLAVVVVVISMVLLRRSILANRNRKKQPQDKETPQVLHLDDSRMKESSNLSNLRETLISEEPHLPPEGTELNEKDAPRIFLPDPQETES